MIIRKQGHKLYVRKNSTTEYPVFSIAIAVILLYLAPFVTSWLAAVSFLICIYRMIRYNARVFAVDYCMLMPISALTKVNGGVALLIYLCLLAGILYLIQGSIQIKAPYFFLIVLLNYLFLRMQMNINDFVLCFGQIFVLCVILPKQSEKSAELSIKVFCLSLVISSCYAYMFRSAPALRGMTGAASQPMWGTNITRFCGLCADPNYYMTYLTVGLALLLKLKESARIRNLDFWMEAAFLVFFGILTYSKMFFLMFLLLTVIYVIWQYWNRKVFRGVFFTIAAIVALTVALTMEDSPFEVVLSRLTSARNLKELTTSRSSVFALYLKAIFADLPTALFGKGLAANALYRDPHNMYLEVAYYTGIAGLLLILGFYVSMMRLMIQCTANAPRQNLISKYMVLAVVLVLYLSLHGMFSQTLYAELFLAYLSILLYRKPGVVVEGGLTSQ